MISDIELGLSSDMDASKCSRGHWTLETLQAEAIKYATRREFQQNNGSAHNTAGRLKLRTI